MDSILVFWNQMTANPLLFVAVTLTLGVILVNGWTDAPNAIATCVVTRCMPPKAAILMAAVFNFLGVFVMFLVTKYVGGNSSKYFVRQQRSLGRVEGFAEEMIHGQKVVKVFCHEDENMENFNRLNVMFPPKVHASSRR